MALEVAMAHGGARNRSGPSADPRSGRSDARGLVFTALPSEGFDGTPPEFPLPSASAREIEVWAQAWRTPQACAWAGQSWRWYTVAQWVRWSVRAEADDAVAAVQTTAIRLADQVGLTPAGLKENGWAVAVDEVGGKRSEAPKRSARDRMKVVNSGDGE